MFQSVERNEERYNGFNSALNIHLPSPLYVTLVLDSVSFYFFLKMLFVYLRERKRERERERENKILIGKKLPKLKLFQL